MNTNTLILILIFIIFAFASNMDYNDAQIAHGYAAECGDGAPAPDTSERADT